jgi:glycine/D-amino acid oxidase-like deaminating enzyme/nitrite reductase/ring-hydroxylating ferredoxin subunit
MSTGERSVSPWKSQAPRKLGEALRGQREADVCVVGAGIAGLTTAYLLARAGRRVVVVDKGPVGGGETAQTTAHLASALDDRFAELERLHGLEGARLAYQSHAEAIDTIERLVAEERIECGFRRLDGYLFHAPDSDPKLLDEELAAAIRVGFPDVGLVDRAPVAGFDSGRALRFPRQAQLEPLAYLDGLARALVERYGAAIYTGTMVERFERSGSPAVLTSDGASVRAADVVVATNSPVHVRFAVHAKQEPYRTFAVAMRAPPPHPPLLLWDDGDPYHYVRWSSDGALLIVGGEDHKTGEEDDADARFARLERWARERFPGLGEVVHAWSGQVMEPVDGMAFIGRSPGDEHMWLATGDSGHGMTHGTIAGLLLGALIAGREHPWAKLYEPTRKTLRSLGTLAKAQLGVTKHLGERLGGAEVGSVNDIARGDGAIVSRGGRKLAVHRDMHGVLHELSAACTHLGCLVHWNSEEKSWDCPCHGSRFACTGEVLNGPAVSPLAPADDDEAVARRRALAV